MNLVLLTVAIALAGATEAGGFQADPQQLEQVPTFRSSVDLVRVTAIVRDHKGRFVQDLTVHDFEVLDGGERRPIAEFSRDSSGVSVALLFDVSGSMEGKLPNAREAAEDVLSWLDPTRDGAAIFTFSTRLDEVVPFTEGLKVLPASMGSMVPFGETSLHDAIAQTAKRAGAREGRHRAVVVLTDGNDNASRLTPLEVSDIASEIDVPVYLFGIVPLIDNPASELSTVLVARSAIAGPLAELAARTGGHMFMASSPVQRSGAARQIVDELRHQYLIAFESNGNPGWHGLVVRARQKDLTVRARNGYMAGQALP
jgi:Ca-activated chloride channel family protein